MKIAFIGNLAGVSNEYVKTLLGMGVEVDLFLNDNEFDAFLNDTKSDENSNIIKYVKKYRYINSQTTNFLIKYFTYVINSLLNIRLIFQLLNYDLIHSHTASLLFSPFSKWLFIDLHIKPYIAAATGSDIREVAQFDNSLLGKWIRSFFKKADITFLLNIDMLHIAEKIKIEKYKFFPFAINTSRYSPAKEKNNYCNESTTLFFLMSRLDWGVVDNFEHRSSFNNNQIVFHAFAKLNNEFPYTKLIVTDRGSDKEYAKKLVIKLNIEKSVQFIPPMDETQRIRHIRLSDVVLDQFYLGAYGLTTLEVMSCEKPIITYINEDYIKSCGLAYPPVLNAVSEEEVYLQMKRSLNKEFREEIGKDARQWILENHDSAKVVQKLIDEYRRLIIHD